MLKEIWKQKRFKTWDEAFRALTPAMRQHSVRVADYTQVLFEGVCKSSFYLRDEERPAYLDKRYSETAYKCGFFHQIGKARKPESYPRWNDNFTLDEKNEYCSYTVEGRELTEELQNGRQGNSDSISDQMIQDSCEFHMEHWDGNGFPYGYAGTEISLIAQIVGLAKEMDRLICERKSEKPYDEAVDIILSQEDKMFSAPLLNVFRNCQPELKNVYKKYIHYTKIMPKTVPLIEKGTERPFGLTYRQIVSGTAVETFIFEAVPWFGGLENSDSKESAQETEALLTRTGLTKDIVIYFLYEAADALARMKNCELFTGGILVPVFSAFYSENLSDRLEKLFSDTAIDRKKLMLTVSESLIKKEHKILERLSNYIDQGVVLVLDDYHPEDVSVALLRKIGFTHVRIAKDSLVRNDIREILQQLKNQGISVINWPSGETNLTEDELIHYLMNHE